MIKLNWIRYLLTIIPFFISYHQLYGIQKDMPERLLNSLTLQGLGSKIYDYSLDPLYQSMREIKMKQIIKEIDDSLLIAASKGSLETVEFLIERGADVNALGTYCTPSGLLVSNVAPLYLAAGNGHKAVTKYLLEKGADPYLFTIRPNFNYTTIEKHILLFKKENNCFEDILNLIAKRMIDIAVNSSCTNVEFKNNHPPLLGGDPSFYYDLMLMNLKKIEEKNRSNEEILAVFEKIRTLRRSLKESCEQV